MKHIIQGVINNTLKTLTLANEDVELTAKHRLSLCNLCALQSNDGTRCDKDKFINEEISGERKWVNDSLLLNPSKIFGCGCILKYKIRSDSECPLNKW